MPLTCRDIPVPGHEASSRALVCLSGAENVRGSFDSGSRPLSRRRTGGVPVREGPPEEGSLVFEAHGPSRGRSPSSEIRALEGGHGHRPASRYQWLWPTTWRLWGFWTLPELRLSSRRYLVDEVSGSYSARAGGRRRFGSVQPFRHSRPVRSWTPTRRLASQLVSPICTSRKYPPLTPQLHRSLSPANLSDLEVHRTP